MAKSVLYSCAIVQKPLSIRIGHLVVIKATAIIIKRGIVASLVNNPNKINRPHKISKEAVKCAQKEGLVKPIFANRPVPIVSG